MTITKISIYLSGLVLSLIMLGFGSIKPFSILALWGDNHLVLTYAKNFINGNGWRINPNLGFPGVQDNLFNPSFDASFTLLLRLVGFVAKEPAQSYYVMYVGGTSAIFVSATASLNSLGVRLWLSAIGGIVYTVSPYFALRALGHDFLALYFAVPLGAILALSVTDEEIFSKAKRSRFNLFLLSSLVLVATSGLYYAYFSALFISLLGLVASVSRMEITPALKAAAYTTIIFLVMVVTGFGFGLFDLLSGSIPMITRYPSEQLVYGLSLAEASHVLSPIPYFRRVYVDYLAARPLLSNTTGLFEWPGILLSLTILLSPVIAGVAGSQQGERNRNNQLIFWCAISLTFGIFYSINGGLAYYFNALVAPSIRATARIMPFLAFFALAIILKSSEWLLARRSLTQRIWGCSLIAVLLICGYPSVGALAARHRLATGGTFYANVDSIKMLLAAKDKAGLSAILQLPHFYWPEVADVRGFSPYSMQDYFILDRRNSITRWSYGGTRQQTSFLLTKNVIDKFPENGLVAAAMGLGFDGALIEKQPYEEIEWTILDRNLSEGGCKIYEDQWRILFSFKSCS